MPDIYEQARAFLLQAEAGADYATRRIAVELGRALPDIVAEAERAAKEFAALREAGAELGRVEQFGAVRARAIAKQVAAEVERIIAESAPAIDAAQRRAVEQGLESARTLALAAYPEGVPADILSRVSAAWQTPPLDAARAAIAAQQPGTPLRALLDAIGPDVSRRVRTQLNAGLLAGQNPRAIGRIVAKSGDLTVGRARVIARTEILRSYRLSSQLAYQANGITRYRRLAAKQRRTCPACLALDSQEQDTAEMMPTHPACRCAVIPLPDLPGVDQRPRQTGAEWLAGQDEATQRAVLGKGGLEAYQRGTPLSAFAKVERDAVWGNTVRVATLSEVSA